MTVPLLALSFGLTFGLTNWSEAWCWDLNANAQADARSVNAMQMSCCALMMSTTLHPSSESWAKWPGGRGGDIMCAGCLFAFCCLSVATLEDIFANLMLDNQIMALAKIFAWYTHSCSIIISNWMHDAWAALDKGR